MSLRRVVVILAATLATLLTVVVLRAEVTRLHSELSQLERQAEVLWQELRERELELARLRNPALIRARVAEMRLQCGPDDRGVAEANSPER
jgi:hypothetical protein